MSGDPNELAVVSGVADVGQGYFLLISFPHLKVLKQAICDMSVCRYNHLLIRFTLLET